MPFLPPNQQHQSTEGIITESVFNIIAVTLVEMFHGTFYQLSQTIL